MSHFWHKSKINRKKLIILLLATMALAVGILLIRKMIFQAAEQNLPLAPSNFKTTDNADKTQIQLQWTDNATNENGFKVERTANILQPFSEIAILPANMVSYTDSANFISNQRYYYRVRAYNSLGDSDYSQIATPTRKESYDAINQLGNMESPANSESQAVLGWYKNSSLPEANKEYIIENKGILGSKSLYIGIKDLIGNGSNGVYAAPPAIDDSNDYTIHHGDKVILSIGKYFMSGDQSANYSAGLYVRGYDQDNIVGTHKFSFSKFTEAEPGSFLSPEIEVLPEYARFQTYVSVSCNFGCQKAGITVDEIKLLIKRAGEDDFFSLTVPIEKTRNFLTQGIDQNDNKPLYQIAQNYDVWRLGNQALVPALKYFNPNIKLFYATKFMLDDGRSDYNLDSNSSIFTDKMAWVVQNHPDWLILYDDTNFEPPSGDRRMYINFNPADDPNPSGSYQYLTIRPDGVTSMNFVFDDFYQSLYAVDPKNENYQQYLKENIVDVVLKYHFDGAWIDNVNMYYDIYDYKDGVNFDLDNLPPGSLPPERLDNDTRQALVYYSTQNELQNFLHNILPYFKTNGVEITLNNAMAHYDKWPNEVLLNPFWSPENPGEMPLFGPIFKGKVIFNNFFDVQNDPSQIQYEANSIETTPDNFFQEYAFFFHGDIGGTYRNYYGDTNHWLKTIEDMEILKEWNANTNYANQKRIHQYVITVDRPDIGDPIFNPPTGGEKNDLNRYDNGSGMYGLASFLLGSNKYSYFGLAKYTSARPDHKIETQFDLKTAMDESLFPIADELGQPVEERKIIYNNNLYSKDDPILDSNDKKLFELRNFQNGMVLVNANPSSEQQYTLDQKLVDEYDRVYPAGSTLNLKPHSGRIFFLPRVSKPLPSPTSSALTPTPTSSPTEVSTPPTEEQPISTPNPTEIPPLTYVTPTPVTTETTPTPATTTENPTSPSPSNLNEPQAQTSPEETKVASKRNKYINWILIILGLIIAFEVVFIWIKSRQQKR